jgi:superfamily II DNA or RNA helicase
MGLRSLSLPSVLDTSSADIIPDFFVPALSRTVRYERGVGFFSSGWLRLAAQGMTAFAGNGGRARWVTSPILSKEDWDALQVGEAARYDDVLRGAIERSLDDLEQALARETLSALAWLIADGVLDFKLALPRNKLERGEFHDKFGVFTDAEGQQVSFNGSYNDSIQGTFNYESIKIFCSWESAFAEIVRADAERFEQLWHNLDPNVRVFDLPGAARAHIVRLRAKERPYPEPSKGEASLSREAQSLYQVYQPIRPSIPSHITLRDYQIEAIDSWFGAGCRGLFEMATGTGKTITALGASIKLYAREKRLALIIACPYQHLVDQWNDEASSFGYTPLRAYRSRTKWLDDLNDRVLSYNYQDIDNLCVITTHSTFSTDHFQKTVERIKGPTLLIADEAHHLGAEHRRQYYPQGVRFRLALSATPDRWYDDVGTAALRAYFGTTVFELSLADAIGLSLTPYYYYPVLVELTSKEIEEYRVLSKKVGQLIAQNRDGDDEQRTRLLIKRARLLNTASNKLDAISDLVSQQPEIKHSLFYCAPGQIDDVVHMLGWEKRLQVHRFTAHENIPTRQRLLRDFAEGKLQALVAMHCLDEGVDVPSTRTAYILASSSNPRQFIQRRGRVLRKSPGKDFATVYDLITVPPPISESDEVSRRAERSILRRELSRFAEFSDSALNTQVAYDVIWDLADQFGVLDFQ